MLQKWISQIYIQNLFCSIFETIIILFHIIRLDFVAFVCFWEILE